MDAVSYFILMFLSNKETKFESRFSSWRWKAIRNFGILPQHYMASEPRRPRLESSPPWRSTISQRIQTLQRQYKLNSNDYSVKNCCSHVIQHAPTYHCRQLLHRNIYPVI